MISQLDFGAFNSRLSHLQFQKLVSHGVLRGCNGPIVLSMFLHMLNPITMLLLLILTSFAFFIHSHVTSKELSSTFQAECQLADYLLTYPVSHHLERQLQDYLKLNKSAIRPPCKKEMSDARHEMSDAFRCQMWKKWIAWEKSHELLDCFNVFFGLQPPKKTHTVGQSRGFLCFFFCRPTSQEKLAPERTKSPRWCSPPFSSESFAEKPWVPSSRNINSLRRSVGSPPSNTTPGLDLAEGLHFLLV